MKYTQKIHNMGYTLIEILIGVLIVSSILIAGFSTLSSVGVARIKLVESIEIEKQAYYAAERFFEMIKKGGTLDYEEYWNRSAFDTQFASGHYLEHSGFGNDGVYYNCISKNGEKMGRGGCLSDFNITADTTNVHENRSGQRQLYNQYMRQFIDYNSDADSDAGDEDTSGESQLSYMGDDDDEYIGAGPAAFSGSRVGELYLISADGEQRTFFRWNVALDPDAPAGATCSGAKDMTGSGCLGTIEFLQLSGADRGYDHLGNTGIWTGDGEIDTWYIDEKFFSGTGPIIADKDSSDYWQPIFPNTLNVSHVEFYAYPNKDHDYIWKENDPELQVAPYIQIQMKLSPSWKQKAKIRGKIPEVDFITTISLTDLDFR